MSALSRTRYAFSCFLILSSTLYAQQITITGTVKDASGTGIAGAMVSVIAAGKSAVTDSSGAYSIVTGATAALPQKPGHGPMMSFLTGNVLNFTVSGKMEHVNVGMYDVSGRKIISLVDKWLDRGSYQMSPLSGFSRLASQLYFLKVGIGDASAVFKMPVVDGTMAIHGQAVNQNNNPVSTGLAKSSAMVDSMLAGSVGYNTASLAIDNYIGTYDFVLDKTVPAGSVYLVQTSQAGDRLSVKTPLVFAADDGSTMPTISIDTTQKFQTIIGFGAAFTEAAVWSMNDIGPAPRKEIMDLFFNPFTGAGFTMGRTQIGSSDFSVGPYFYDTTANDFSMNNFSLLHDQQWMIPMIKQAKAVPGANIKIFAAPWSPPPWMKTTNNWLHGSLLTNCYAAFALYLCRYVEQMNQNGIDLWGITMQNEPAFDSPWYPSCSYTSQQEKTLLRDNFGPQLRAEGLLGKVNVMIWDHNKDLLNSWGNTIIGDTMSGKYAFGAAYHWYSGDMFDSLVAFHDKYPGKILVETEVAEPFKGYNADGTYKVDWGQAEREGHDLIGDMNHWGNGWNEWNLCVDDSGGPGWTGSVGSAPVIMNRNSKTYIVQPHYYMIAHFSKYVRPGAVRIGYLATSIPANVEFTAFRNGNGSVAVVIMNRTVAAVSIKLKQGTQIVKPSVPAHSFITMVF